MSVASRSICALIAGGLLVLPCVAFAENLCILGEGVEFPGYVNRLADGIGNQKTYVYGQGDDDTPEHAFVRGAIGMRAADLFMTVQFDRSGIVTDFDVQRLSDRPVDEVLVRLLDECLDPYAEDLGALAEPIGKQVQSQLEEEERRKSKLGL